MSTTWVVNSVKRGAGEGPSVTQVEIGGCVRGRDVDGTLA